MTKILAGNDGGAPTLNFVRSLRRASTPRRIIGMGAHAFDLCKSEADETHLIPYAKEETYLPIVRDLVQRLRPDFLHVQNDAEVKMVSDHRESLGVKTFLPAKETVSICINKWRLYEKWSAAGLQVPRTSLISTEEDLKRALQEFGPTVWLRAYEGAFGYGAAPVDNFDFGRIWIDKFQGWGKFTAAECLTPQSVTWTSLWKNGELIVAQGRKRLYWEFSNRNLAGVTGITGTGATVSDPIVDEIARKAVMAVDAHPQGLFSVDLTYDHHGVPNLTEINIGRFFTTHEFFAAAGLNVADLYVRCALDEPLPDLPIRLNPLPPGLVWIRGMDSVPVLTTLERIETIKATLDDWKSRIAPPTSHRS